VAIDRLRLGSEGITTFMTADGAGGLLGALATLSIVGRGGLALMFAVGMVGRAATFGAIGETVVPAAALVLAFARGVAGAVALAVAPTLVQRSVARDAVVPAVASLQSLYQIAMAGGAMIAPLFIDWFGVAAALAGVGGSVVIFTVLMWPQTRRAQALSVC
jgi:predicted MFS family arabinose efflux permease